MGVTIFMHPTLWCHDLDCLLTCWTITSHTILDLQPKICQQLRYSTDNTRLVFTALLLIEHNRNITLDCVLLCHLIQNKNLRDVRSDIQLNLGIRTDP